MAINDAPDWQRQVTVNTDLIGTIPVTGAPTIEPMRLDIYSVAEYPQGHSVYSEEVPTGEQWTIQRALVMNSNNPSERLGISLKVSGSPYKILDKATTVAKECVVLDSEVVVCAGEKIMGWSLNHTTGDRIQLWVIGYKQDV